MLSFNSTTIDIRFLKILCLKLSPTAKDYLASSFVDIIIPYKLLVSKNILCEFNSNLGGSVIQGEKSHIVH